jgi:bifunctional non-homologous end joining protein LigD
MTKAASGSASEKAAAPGEAAPGEAAPGEAAPGRPAFGKAAVPGKAAPGTATPGMAAAGKAAPGRATPGKATPGKAAPGKAAPGKAERGTAAAMKPARGRAASGKAAGKGAVGDGSATDGGGAGGGEGAGGGKGRVSRRTSGGRDPLATYRGMRDPERTPEPVPAAGPVPEGNDDTFVIQEHHARSLHWDVRLERDGVLVSWAVPKGLPLNPKDNRLAVHTEDHPIDYGSFEGDIPAGEYGGGKVILWDRGRYEMEEWTDREVKVVFHGNRAEGRYVFFQTRGSDWMVHRMDGPPFPDWQPVPTDLTPMTATEGPLPSGGRRHWAYELAWVGNRVLVAVEGGRIRIRDEKGRDVSAAYPELRAMGAELGSTVCLLDGEVVALGKDGRPDPSLLRRRPARQAAPGAKDLREVPITFLAFDLLHLDGRDLTGRPYEERRAVLETLGLEGDRWGVAPAVPGTGRDALQVAHGLGLNGVVAKRRRSPYRPGVTTADWVLATD